MEMWKVLIVVWMGAMCADESVARVTLHRLTHRHTEDAPLFSGTSFDYDYGPDDRRSQHAVPIMRMRMALPVQRTGDRPTRRPLMSYWQNLVRNVRLSMPTITWNITNPFTNLFNGGEPNLVETQVNPQYEEYMSSIQKRRRISQRRKSSKRRTKPTSYDYNDLVEGEGVAGNAINDYYNGQAAHAAQAAQAAHAAQAAQAAQAEQMQYMLRPYENNNVRTPVLLYDPRTDQYYEVQPVRKQLQNAIANENHGIGIKDESLLNTDDDEFVEIVGTKTDESSNNVKTLSTNNVDTGTDGNNAKQETTTATDNPQLETIKEAERSIWAIPKPKHHSAPHEFTAKGKSHNLQNRKMNVLYYSVPRYTMSA